MRDGCPCSMSPTPSAPNVPGESGAAPDARTLVPVADVEAGPAAALDEAPPDRDAGLRPPGARDSVPLYLSDRALRR